MFTTTPHLFAATALAAVGLAGATFGVPALAGSSDASTSARPAATVVEPAPPAEPIDAETVDIDCGGYDADGELVHPEAARIEAVPVDHAGVPQVPEICGGYTVDGVMVGDD